MAHVNSSCMESMTPSLFFFVSSTSFSTSDFSTSSFSFEASSLLSASMLLSNFCFSFCMSSLAARICRLAPSMCPPSLLVVPTRASEDGPAVEVSREPSSPKMASDTISSKSFSTAPSEKSSSMAEAGVSRRERGDTR